MIDERTSDRELVRRWQAGVSREEVFEILQRRYARSFAQMFRRMGFDDATCEDLVQEAFFQTFRFLGGFRLDASVRTWIYQIARNVALKRHRHDGTKKRTGQEVRLDDVDGDDRNLEQDPRVVRADGPDGPHGRLVSKERTQQVRTVLDELSPVERRMVRFRVWHGLSVRETAQAMRKPEGTIKSGWARLRKKLVSQFADLPL